MRSHLASTDQRNNCIPAKECGGWRACEAGRRTARPDGRAEAGEKAWSRGAAHGTTATTRAAETSEGSRERRRRAAVRVVGFALFFSFFVLDCVR